MDTEVWAAIAAWVGVAATAGVRSTPARRRVALGRRCGRPARRKAAQDQAHSAQESAEIARTTYDREDRPQF